MRRAELCPVCKGAGKANDKTCHGCYGRGWVVVGFDYPPKHDRVGIQLPEPRTEPWPNQPDPPPKNERFTSVYYCM